jgi:hypothetical protein
VPHGDSQAGSSGGANDAAASQVGHT